MPAESLELGPPDIDAAAGVLSLSPAEAALLRADHPFLRYGDWRVFAALQAGTAVARLVASVDPRQRAAPGNVGCIGFVALEGSRSPSPAVRASAERLINAALRWLDERRVAVVRCPVQLATTYGHRAITAGSPEDGGAPAFPLEPRDGRALVDLLRKTGFDPAHVAVSCAVSSDAVLASTNRVIERLRRAGWEDLQFDVARLDDELALLHRLSLEAFRESWGFSEISFAEFRALYEPAARHADPELVRIARDRDGRPLGFGFAVPDHPKPTGSTGIVVKTLAVAPGVSRRYPGAGPGLTAMVHRAALERGFQDGVHALMAKGSNGHRFSMRWGTQIREYATFERALR